MQGEILEGLVARVVSRESSEHMEQVLRDYPVPPLEEGNLILFNFCFHLQVSFFHQYASVCDVIKVGSPSKH